MSVGGGLPPLRDPFETATNEASQAETEEPMQEDIVSTFGECEDDKRTHFTRGEPQAAGGGLGGFAKTTKQSHWARSRAA